MKLFGREKPHLMDNANFASTLSIDADHESAGYVLITIVNELVKTQILFMSRFTRTLNHRFRVSEYRLHNRSSATKRSSRNTFQSRSGMLPDIPKSKMPNDPKLSHGHRRPTQQCNGDNQISFVGRD